MIILIGILAVIGLIVTARYLIKGIVADKGESLNYTKDETTIKFD